MQGPRGGRGPEGPQGDPGPTGFTGPRGPEGPAGTGLHIKGIVEDKDDLPTHGNEKGDCWITEEDGHVWIWYESETGEDRAASGRWVDAGPLRGPVGATGPQGLIGPPGERGPEGFEGPEGQPGIQGPQGVPGEVGPRGACGPPGVGIYLKGTVPTSADLPMGCNQVGDAWVAEDTGDVWMWNGCKWVDLGKIQGPQGPQGDQGVQGPEGPEGEEGPIGFQGERGVQGPRGMEGPIGPPGTGVAFRGTVHHAGQLPPSGNKVGDGYLTENDGHLWAWSGHEWIDQGNIRGPQGLRGPEGPEGPPGIQGDRGPEGQEGVRGPQGIPGVEGPFGPPGPAGAGVCCKGSVPTYADLPKEDECLRCCDAYITADTGHMWVWDCGNNVWVDVGHIQGPPGPPGMTGAEGPRGPQGNEGPLGPTGPQGPRGPEGMMGPQGQPGAQGPAGTGINIKGEVESHAHLPPGPHDNGDAWITKDTGHLWVWEGTKFVDAGDIVGPAGPQGPPGAQGPPGQAGAPGAQGPPGQQGPSGENGQPGAQGPPGNTGPQGPPGPKGDQGEPGEPGTGINLKGTVPKHQDLPESGNQIGDAWLTENDGHIWVWDGTHWIDGGKLSGEAGEQGPPGEPGEQGPEGPEGPPGPVGPPGPPADLDNILAGTGISVSPGPGPNQVTINYTGGLWQQGSNGAIYYTGGAVGVGTIPHPAVAFQFRAGANQNLAFSAGQFVGGVAIQSYNDAVTVYQPLEYRASLHYFAQGPVGIGVTNPVQPLEVAGNVNVRNGCYLINGTAFACSDGAGGIALSNITTINGAAPGGGGGTPAPPNRSVQWNNNDAFGGSSGLIYTSSGELRITGLNPATNGSFIEFMGAQSGDMLWYMGSDPLNRARRDFGIGRSGVGTPIYIQEDTGYVGISDQDPTYPLTISGSVNIIAEGNPQHTFRIDGVPLAFPPSTSGVAQGWQLTVGAGGSVNWTEPPTQYWLPWAVGNIYTNNKVGINTTDISYQFEVSGRVRFKPYSSDTAGCWFNTSGRADAFFLGVTATSDFRLYSAFAAANVLYFDGLNSRAGFNRANANYTVDVNGDVNSTGCYRINGTSFACASGAQIALSNIATINGQAPGGAAATPGAPANSVQFNNANAFGGDDNFVFYPTGPSVKIGGSSWTQKRLTVSGPSDLGTDRLPFTPPTIGGLMWLEADGMVGMLHGFSNGVTAFNPTGSPFGYIQCYAFPDFDQYGPIVLQPLQSGGNAFVGIGKFPTVMLDVAGPINCVSLGASQVNVANAFGATVSFRGVSAGIDLAMTGPANQRLQISNGGRIDINSSGGDIRFISNGTGSSGGMSFTWTGNGAIYLNATSGFVGIGSGMHTPTYRLTLLDDSAGKPGTNTWTITSDMRTKRKVNRFEGDIDVIRKLEPNVAEYNGKCHTPEGMRVVSFDPEELRKVCSQAVTVTRGKLNDDDEKETDILGINTHELFFHLLRAVQNIDARLAKLEKKNNPGKSHK